MIEFLFFNHITEKWAPNLLLLLIIFTHLAIGKNYALFSAAAAGLFKDAFTADVFGFHLFSYMICAYLLIHLTKLVYRKGSPTSRLLLTFVVVLINFIIQYLIFLASQIINFFDAFAYIFVPQLLMTLLLAPYIFKQLEKCVLRLFVLL